MLGIDLKTPSAVEQKRPGYPTSFAALMVHVDIERDCEPWSRPHESR
jgi:hypothetical protein